MSRIDTPIWDLDEHTEAKHEILRNYLGGWFPILARWSGRIIYLDGFAGPGVYSKGEIGSPIIALRTASEHMLRPHDWAEIIFLFIEKEKERAKILQRELKKNFPELPEKIRYFVISDEFESTIDRLLDQLNEEKKKLAPCFAFIDPFGFTGFSMELLKKFLSHEKCEVLITFMAGFVHRFLDELREPALDTLYGTKEWRKIREIEGSKIKPLLELYEHQLKVQCGASFTRSFEMVGSNGQILYYMIFATKHWLGLKVMKEAMWSVDRRGEYTFSDRIGRSQTFLIDYQEDKYWVPEAAEEIYNKFKGTSASVKTIEQFIVTETKYLFRKSILVFLEESSPDTIKKVIVPNRERRKRSFPDDAVIIFA
jgi:three-Cys-motif partner protein